MRYMFHQDKKISKRASNELILMMSKYGDNSYFLNKDSKVRRFFRKHGYNYEELIEHCRDFSQPIPLVENMLPSTSFIEAQGSKVIISRVDGVTVRHDISFEGSGALTMFNYLASFETAYRALKRSISTGLPQEFLASCVNGVASIESYINFKAEVWNVEHQETKLVDTRRNPVPFDSKVDLWVPAMTQGKKLDKSIVNWPNFKRLRALRDNTAIHPKASGYGFSFKELAELINCFKTGISGILIQLHILFEDEIPSVIVRSFFEPDVKVAETKD